MRISTSQIHQQGISGISRLSAQSADTQQQIASGKRVRTPSDDPAAAAKIVRLNQEIASRDRYIRNADTAEAQLQREESVLSTMTDALHRVRELTLQAGDPAYSAADQAFLGAELEVRFAELLALANSQDAQGNYLFSGYQADQKPFSFINGTISYQGDTGQREIAIEAGRTIAISDPGHELFTDSIVDFPSIRVRAANATAPDLRSLTATVTNPEVLNEVNANRLLIEVQDLNGRTVLAVKNADDGTAIAGLNAVGIGPVVALAELGIDLGFAKSPAAGDRFVLEITQRQGLLTSVHAIAQALTMGAGAGKSGSPLSDAGRQQVIAQTLDGLDAALDSVVSTQAQIGARLNAIDSTRELHRDVVLKTQEVLSDVEDIDFAEAVSKLNYQTFLLEAAQQSFVRVNRLSLFNSL